MRVLCHFAVVGLSNTYLIGPSEGGDAILIDPSRFDSHLLNMIEENGYYIRSILVTHDHENHVRGTATALKIYDAKIYGGTDSILGFPCTRVEEGKPIDLNGFTIEPLEIKGHSADSLVYRIDNYLFTGDILSAGRIGTSGSTWAKANLIKDIGDKILSLPKNTILLPGHGPPSTLEIEHLTNKDIEEENLPHI